MNLSNEFWIELLLQMLMYGVSFGAVYGAVRTKLNYMEKKLEKHNNFAERVIALEQSSKSAHHRIDEIKAEICREFKERG